MKRMTKKFINIVRNKLDKLSDLCIEQIKQKTSYSVDVRRVGGVTDYEYLYISIGIADPDKKENIYDGDDAFYRMYYTNYYTISPDKDIEEIDRLIAEATEFVTTKYPRK